MARPRRTGSEESSGGERHETCICQGVADAAGAVYSTVPAESDESDYYAGRRSRADYAAPFEATKLEIRKNFPNAPLALTENV